MEIKTIWAKTGILEFVWKSGSRELNLRVGILGIKLKRN